MNTLRMVETCKPPIPDFHVIVQFGAGIPAWAQASTMFQLERSLREAGVPVEVFKHEKADDLKSRASMTAYERANL